MYLSPSNIDRTCEVTMPTVAPRRQIRAGSALQNRPKAAPQPPRAVSEASSRRLHHLAALVRVKACTRWLAARSDLGRPAFTAIAAVAVFAVVLLFGMRRCQRPMRLPHRDAVGPSFADSWSTRTPLAGLESAGLPGLGNTHAWPGAAIRRSTLPATSAARSVTRAGNFDPAARGSTAGGLLVWLDYHAAARDLGCAKCTGLPCVADWAAGHPPGAGLVECPCNWRRDRVCEIADGDACPDLPSRPWANAWPTDRCTD